MPYTIKIIGNTLDIPGPEDGKYLKEFHPDTDAHGKLIVTSNRDEAMQFEDGGEAWKFWQQQSKRFPLRLDGKPNRPLTAFTVEIAKHGVDDAER